MFVFLLTLQIRIRGEEKVSSDDDENEKKGSDEEETDNIKYDESGRWLS